MKRISVWIGIAILTLTIIIASTGITNMQSSRAAQRLDAQRRAVERAAVLCYALEGAYPPNAEYLEERYGLIVDHDRYILYYKTFGANIRPEIEVFSYE